MASPSPAPSSLFWTTRFEEDRRYLHDHWVGFLLFGVLLAVLGFIALTYAVLASLVTAVFFGYLLLIGGIFFLVGSFFTRGWGGFFLALLAGVLYLVTGAIILNHPTEGLIVYTLLLAVLFCVEGLFRIVSALVGRFHHWGWMLLSGIVTLILGVLIWQQWPFSGLYVVGLFLGINLIMSGANYIALGLAARRLAT
jgi:uncharacterized membrane protein HdeD (DUF308 family)